MIKKTFNLPIILSEKASTVSAVTTVVSVEAFDGETVVLLDANNLLIPDSGGTRGRLNIDTIKSLVTDNIIIPCHLQVPSFGEEPER